MIGLPSLRGRKAVPHRTAGELDSMAAAGALVAKALLAVRQAALKDRQLDTEVRKPAEARKYEAAQEADARKYAAEQEAEAFKTSAIRKAEAEAQRQRSTLVALINAIPDPIWFKDAQGRYLGINQACAELFGKTAPSLAIYHHHHDHSHDLHGSVVAPGTHVHGEHCKHG